VMSVVVVSCSTARSCAELEGIDATRQQAGVQCHICAAGTAKLDIQCSCNV